MTYTPLKPRFFLPSLTSDVLTPATSSRPSVTCTASATPHQPGAWVEVDASLSEESCAYDGMFGAGTSVNGVDTSTLVEVGTGAAGSEVVWATYPVGYVNATNRSMWLPGAMAAGTRVAIRARSAVASQSVLARPSFNAVGTYKNYLAPITYGVDTSTSRGTALQAPGALNAKSAWTEFSSGVSRHLTAIYIGIQGNGGTAMSGTSILIDIGKGPAGGGSQEVIAGDIHFLGGTSENYLALNPTTYRVDVYPGERLYVRYQRGNANNAVDAILVAA